MAQCRVLCQTSPFELGVAEAFGDLEEGQVLEDVNLEDLGSTTKEMICE